MDIDFIIDGAAVASDRRATFDRQDPVTRPVATTAAAATLADVERVVASAAKAFASWSETGPNARRALADEGRRPDGEPHGRFRQADAGGDRRDRALGRLQRPSCGRHPARGRFARPRRSPARSSPPTSPASCPWRSASRSAWCSAWHRGTRPSSSVPAPSRPRSPAAIPSCCAPRRSAPAPIT